jgi:hypothetical protein
LTTLDLNFLSAKIASLGLKMANQIKILWYSIIKMS